MEEKITVIRPASGTGTIVKIVIQENGIRVVFSHKSSVIRLHESVKLARDNAMEMLNQIKEERHGRLVG